VKRSLALAFALAAAVPAGAAESRVQRFTLIVGANLGGADRPRLQYAIADAERVARVMTELGGVEPANEIILRQPRLSEMVDALDRLKRRVTEARRRAGGGRTEVLLYYSGHADEQGLLLADDRYSYRTLRDRLDDIPADVRIAVLDACASGAFTRMKSGRPRPAFLVDESSAMRGHAFLTSSAATEAAQESDRIRASYFTHYLVSGFRGAADLSGDGRVTLSEAYQFAFNETLGRTVDTKGGAQHPSYDISLSGTGDVVMTDLRQTTATLVLAEDLDGRFFIRNARGELVVELSKPRGRRIELGVEPGAYEIRLEIEKRSLLAKATVADGAHVSVDQGQFGPAAVETAHKRGGSRSGPPLAVNGRNRIALRWGMWNSPGARVTNGVGTTDLFGGVEYARYIREDLSIAITFVGLEGIVGTESTSEGVFAGTADIGSVQVLSRWNPFAKGREAQPIKPYVAVGVGPVFGSSVGTFSGSRARVSGVNEQATVGGHVGGGVDFHLARWFSVGVNGGYNWMADFSTPVGARSNYSGPEFGMTFGFLFGKGHTRE
jgi:caspase domain-containing protein